MKYRMPKGQKPERTVGGGPERLACLEGRLGQDGALSDRAVPPLAEKPTQAVVPVMLVLEVDSGPSFQGVSSAESRTEDPVGAGAVGGWEV